MEPRIIMHIILIILPGLLVITQTAAASTVSIYTATTFTWIPLTPYGITAAGKERAQFCVKACYNAFFGLFTSDVNTFYSVLIGGALDTRSVIRRRKSNETTLKKVFYGSRLDCNNSLWFNVSWSNGVVAACSALECFASFVDPSPLNVEYFAVSTYTNSEGKWEVYKEDHPVPECLVLDTSIPSKSGTESVDIKASTVSVTTIPESTQDPVSSTIPESTFDLGSTATYLINNATTDRSNTSCGLCCAKYFVQTNSSKFSVEDLKISKQNTFRYKSRLISVYDGRTSSKSMGYVAVLVICFPVAAIIMIDVLNMAKRGQF